MVFACALLISVSCDGYSHIFLDCMLEDAKSVCNHKCVTMQTQVSVANKRHFRFRLSSNIIHKLRRVAVKRLLSTGVLGTVKHVIDTIYR